MADPKDDSEAGSKTSKGTAHFVAEEIHKAAAQANETADNNADRLAEGYQQSISILKETHAKALEAEEKRSAFLLKLAYGMGALFALSLITNVVLVAGLLRTPVTVNPDGVVIGAGAPSQRPAPASP